MDWLAALGSLLMFLLLLSCSNDMFVCLFYTFQKTFCPARDESFMNCRHQYKVVLIPTLLYFILCFSGKMVIQKTKKVL